jgi:hypothetical protein
LNSGNEETGEKSETSSLPKANLGTKLWRGLTELRGEPFSTEVEVELGDLLSDLGGWVELVLLSLLSLCEFPLL